MSKIQKLYERETYLNDPYTRIVPRTEEAQQALRKRDEALADAGGYMIGDTCDACSRRYVCELVYDAYNTDGDCLYDK